MTKATLRAIDRPSNGTVTSIPQRVTHLPVLAETAHDLNNALGAIRLHLELLAHDLLAHNSLSDDKIGADKISAEKVRKRLRQLQPAVEHASAITRQLMNPESLASGLGDPRQNRTALNPVLQRMVPILSAMLPPGVDLHLRLAPNLGTVLIDPVQVVRIVSNLVLNSCAALGRDANPIAGSIVIETARGRDAECLVLRVRDTGPGMSATTRANLFRPFFTTKPYRDTAGLGLASVLRIVRRAGGSIQIDSTPGEGTDIAITFPAVASRGKKKPSQLIPCTVAREGNSGTKSGPQIAST